MSSMTNAAIPRQRTRLTTGAIRSRVAALRANRPELSSADIANELGIGVRTVKYHTRHLRDTADSLRLGRWNTGELVIVKGDVELVLDESEVFALRCFIGSAPAGAAP